MKKKIVLIIVCVVAFLLVFGVWFVYSTGISIEGKIQDSITMKPIEGAQIRLGNSILESDENGAFIAYTSILPKSSLIIEKKGYKPFEKKLSFSGIIDTKKYEIVLEPLSFVNILNNTQANLSSYASYSFKSAWKQQIDTPQQTITYMKYLLSSDGVVYFKILTDDKKGDALSSKEIITTGEKIYYKTLKDENWTSFDASQIRGSEMQEPEDIMFLFLGDGEPGEFREEEMETWYLKDDGTIVKKPKDVEGFVPFTVLVYKALWEKGKIEQEVVLYLDEKYHVIAGELEIIAPQGLNTEEPGKMNKQSIEFTITNINKPVGIAIPEIDEI
ncbi:MAG: hypothetical protein KAH01_03280 [Caldisericia bacterium]|nr:hypothetical protein [Caldisericia bacterium]